MMALKLLLSASLSMLPFMKHPPRQGLGSEEHCTIPNLHRTLQSWDYPLFATPKSKSPLPRSAPNDFLLNYFDSQNSLYSILLQCEHRFCYENIYLWLEVIARYV